MIQLATATDPNASSRLGSRSAANDGKANPFEIRRRAGHAWPFISSHADRPASRDASSNNSTDNGS